MSKSALRTTLDEAVLSLAFQSARISAYTANPALDSDGGPLPLPLRFRIAYRTAAKREAAARAEYVAAYPKSRIAADARVLVTA